MFEKAIVGLLQRYLGSFVDGLDKESLKVGLWSGKVVLKDFALQAHALHTLGLPLVVKSGRVKRLQMDIPWRRLGKEPALVTIVGVSVVVGPLDEQELSAAVLQEWTWKRKQYRLQALLQAAELQEEAASLLGSGGATPKRLSAKVSKGGKPKRQSTLSRQTAALMNKILDSLQVSLSEVQLRYEDATHSTTPFAIGLTLDSLITGNPHPNPHPHPHPPQERWRLSACST